MAEYQARLGSRELFPDLEVRAYLNHTAMSPLSVAVRDVIALQKALGDRAVGCNVPDGYLRFSPHWPNALDEIDYVVESVEACVVAAAQVQQR